MIIRPLESRRDVTTCVDLVRDNWGTISADRAMEQMYEHFKGGKYAPKFFVADAGSIVGFSAYQRSMRMHGTFDLIWLAVDTHCHSSGIGKKLTEHRLAEIEKLGGTVITLVTQKVKYFEKFGFITGTHLGNGWVEMVKLVKHAGME
jgi:N-acetylglutamate synthase-like GNAT family acetyltransferase